jgi:transcriptional regulator with XRE-family HTH domain
VVVGDERALESFPFSGFVRRVRRSADLSQRKLAQAASISSSTIGRIEAGSLVPAFELFRRLLDVAGLRVVVVDAERHEVLPMEDWEDTRDGAERRYPAHLDTILDPKRGDWWGDQYGLSRPPETFARDRYHRDLQRARSQWEVRVDRFRGVPPPPVPPNYRH